MLATEFVVSILTRLEGRVQLETSRADYPGIGVSILTRLEGRVQPCLRFPRRNLMRFQSSPDSKVGCNVKRARKAMKVGGFNPHPTRRSGATKPELEVGGRCIRFNPHPTRRSGATILEPIVLQHYAVSILTRLEGRVQPRRSGELGATSLVSILTRLEGRVQHGFG